MIIKLKRLTLAYVNVDLSPVTVDDVIIPSVTHTLTKVTTDRVKSLAYEQPHSKVNGQLKTHNYNILPGGQGREEMLNESLTFTNFWLSLIIVASIFSALFGGVSMRTFILTSNDSLEPTFTKFSDEGVKR